MTRFPHVSNAVVALLALSVVTTAQTTILRLPSPIPGSGSGGYGTALCGVADVNADGFDEVLVASPLESTLQRRAGAVRLYSGVDGTLLQIVHGTSAQEGFGRAVHGLGDVDGDGRGDFAVAWRPYAGPGIGGLRFYSGATAALLFEIQGGDARQNFAFSVRAGDVDGDGVEDVAVPGNVGLPYDIVEDGLVWVFSGADGSLLLQVDGLPVFGPLTLGTTVAAAGDVDLDGHDDLLVASTSSYGGLYQGLVRLVSGANGALLGAWSGAPTVDRVNGPIGSAGDWNADGRNDWFLTRYPEVPMYLEHGVIEVRSGADGAVLQSLAPSSPTEVYRTCVNVGDVDGDGREDLGLASTVDIGLPWRPMSVRVLAGGSGLPLFPLDRELQNQAWILPIAGAGDVSGDGLPDLVCGLVEAPGEVVVFAGLPLEIGIAQCIGGTPGYSCPCANNPAPGDEAGCVNSTGGGARLAGVGVHLYLNDELELLVSGAPADVPLILLRGPGLGNEPAVLSDGVPCLGVPWVAQVARTDAAGGARLVEHPGLSQNETTHYQAWYRDATGGSPCGRDNNFTQVLQVKAE